jgi:hypothetical protein
MSLEENNAPEGGCERLDQQCGRLDAEHTVRAGER